MASMNSSDELSLADKGVGITTCVDSLQSFVKTNGRRPTTLTLTKNHAIGVDGMVTLAESWLAPSTKSESDEGNSIEILNIASCSVGRCINPDTGANILTDKALCSLGKNGDRLVSIDLSWNDLNNEAIEGLVRGLLDIKGPGFEAESYNPATLLPSRTCALETLKLKGNSICDEGVQWLSRLLHDPTGTTLKSRQPSKLKHLDLYQCALQENGAEILCECLALETEASSKLVSLDVRENDVKSWSRALAEAAIKSPSLIEFCGINFSEVNGNISKAFAGEVVTLVAGKDAMNHGTLALLLSLRPFIFPTATSVNPLAHKADDSVSAMPQGGGGKASGSIALDLRGSSMCGFYWEEVESVEELIELLKGCVGTPIDSSDAQAASTNSPNVTISVVELDDDCGLTDKQIRSLYDATIPLDQAQSPLTLIKLNGMEYKPSWGCSVM